MWQQTTKTPAWISLKESPIQKFDAASAEEIQAIRQVLKTDAQVERMVLGSRFLNMYRVKNYLPNADMLLRWESDELDPGILERFKITEWLFNHGTPTPQPCLSPLRVEAIKNVWGRGYVSGMIYYPHLHLSLDDVKIFGGELARFHKVLATHSQQPQWFHNTEQRLRHLTNIRKKLAEGDLRLSPFAERLKVLARDSRLDFARWDLPRQPLHGDLNFGNAFVKAEKSGDKPTIMIYDFEDIHHSCLPVEFEFVYFIERFVMLKSDDENEIKRTLRAFVQSYLKENSLPLARSAGAWTKLVQSINLRSLCVSASIAHQGGDVADKEWEKSFQLYELAEERSHLWESLNP